MVCDRVRAGSIAYYVWKCMHKIATVTLIIWNGTDGSCAGENLKRLGGSENTRAQLLVV